MEVAPPVAPVESPKPEQPAWRMEPIGLPEDLVMIETTTKADTTAYTEPAPRPVRTPRPRPQAPAIPDEPLQQVETRSPSTGGSA